jgi:5-formyltetrahydrofolate cyclo-ligase
MSALRSGRPPSTRRLDSSETPSTDSGRSRLTDVNHPVRAEQTVSDPGLDTGAGTRARVAKEALRGPIRAQRLMDSEETRRAAAHDLCRVFMELPQVRRARSVALYTSAEEEPGTHLARKALAALGIRVLLPVTGAGATAWVYDADPLCDVRSRDEAPPWARPQHCPTLDDVAVLLVPALAVDTLGGRLGRGLGHYDRVLRQFGPNTLTMAAVYEREVFDAAVEPLPAETHGRPAAAATA